jgi:hypothetical protein
MERLKPTAKSLLALQGPNRIVKIRSAARKLNREELASLVRDFVECVDTYIYYCDLYEREADDPDSYRSRRHREYETALAEDRRPRRPELREDERDTFVEILSAWGLILQLAWLLRWAFPSHRLDSCPVIRTANGFAGTGAMTENNYRMRALLPHWSEDKLALQKVADQVEVGRPPASETETTATGQPGRPRSNDHFLDYFARESRSYTRAEKTNKAIFLQYKAAYPEQDICRNKTETQYLNACRAALSEDRKKQTGKIK